MALCISEEVSRSDDTSEMLAALLTVTEARSFSTYERREAEHDMCAPPRVRVEPSYRTVLVTVRTPTQSPTAAVTIAAMAP